jgi:hypothetical protein
MNLIVTHDFSLDILLWRKIFVPECGYRLSRHISSESLFFIPKYVTTYVQARPVIVIDQEAL